MENEKNKLDENGLRTGEWVEYYDNGQIRYKGYFFEGKREGEWVLYHNNGKLFSKGFYVEGKQTGEWEFYYEDGQLWYKGSFSEGKKTGEFVYYYENGQIKSTNNYLFNYEIKVDGDMIVVGCKKHTKAYWLANWKEIAEQEDVSEEVAESIYKELTK